MKKRVVVICLLAAIISTGGVSIHRRQFLSGQFEFPVGDVKGMVSFRNTNSELSIPMVCYYNGEKMPAWLFVRFQDPNSAFESVRVERIEITPTGHTASTISSWASEFERDAGYVWNDQKGEAVKAKSSTSEGDTGLFVSSFGDYEISISGRLISADRGDSAFSAKGVINLGGYSYYQICPYTLRHLVFSNYAT